MWPRSDRVVSGRAGDRRGVPRIAASCHNHRPPGLFPALVHVCPRGHTLSSHDSRGLRRPDPTGCAPWRLCGAEFRGDFTLPWPHSDHLQSPSLSSILMAGTPGAAKGQGTGQGRGQCPEMAGLGSPWVSRAKQGVVGKCQASEREGSGGLGVGSLSLGTCQPGCHIPMLRTWAGQCRAPAGQGLGKTWGRCRG